MLSYKVYNKTKLAVYDPEKKYTDIMKKYDARFYKKLKDETSGYLFPIEHEQVLKQIVDDNTPIIEKSDADKSDTKSDPLDEMSRHAKPRQDQQKYRRAKSKSKEDVDLAYYKKYTKYIKTPEYSESSEGSSHSSSLGDEHDRRHIESPPRRRREETPPRRRRESPPPIRRREETPPRRREEQPHYRRIEASPPPRRREQRRDDRRVEASPTRAIKDEMRYLQQRLKKMEDKLYYN